MRGGGGTYQVQSNLSFSFKQGFVSQFYGLQGDGGQGFQPPSHPPEAGTGTHRPQASGGPGSAHTFCLPAPEPGDVCQSVKAAWATHPRAGLLGIVQRERRPRGLKRFLKGHACPGAKSDSKHPRGKAPGPRLSKGSLAMA